MTSATSQVSALRFLAEQEGDLLDTSERVGLARAGYGPRTPTDMQRPVPIVVDAIAAPTADPVIVKEAPSAFLGTPLRRWLTRWGADGVVLCGSTASGCVRATTADAFSHGLLVIIVADATFDGISVAHRASLLDLELKYADVSSFSAIGQLWETLGSTSSRPRDVSDDPCPLEVRG